jgi:predicted nucleic acid-binding protein
VGEGVLIDTDILINYIKGLTELPKGPVFISEITLYEFLRGSRDPARAKRLLEEGFRIIFHDNDVILKASELWRTLKESGEMVEDRDLLIAAVSISKNLPLMTGNLRHFDKFRNFGLEFWKSYSY